MPQFAANLSMLFTEWPFLDRFDRAAQAGFRFVEFQFPYEVPAAEIRARLDRHQLQAVLHNTPAGNRASGERGIACHPDRVDEFRAGVARAVEYATTLGVPRVNVLSGKRPPGVDEAALRRTLVAKLAYSVGKDPTVASQHDWFVATALTVRDRIIDRWFPSTRTIYREHRKG